MCIFPARSEWILKNLPSLKKEIKIPKCNKIDNYFKTLNPNSTTLIFPTAYLNSPAAMFGHTFLRLNQNNSPLLSHAINFSAKVDNINIFSYLINGIFGGFEGYFSLQKYYEKIKEYTFLRQRDIWEYELNFTKEELRKVVLHLVELDLNYSYYYFFSKNCSYHLLWLFEIAKEELEFVEKFRYKTTPIDTIRVIDEYNLIKYTFFRSSKVREMRNILNQKIKNKKLAIDFIKNNQPINHLSKNQKIYTLDLAIEYLQYRQNFSEDEALEERVFDLMRQRSRLGVLKYSFPPPVNPLKSHKNAKIETRFLKNSFELRIKPTYHSIKDNDYGFADNSYISFFDLLIEKKKDFHIKRFDLVDISSFVENESLFNFISWRAKLGFDKIFDEKRYFNAKFGIGYSVLKYNTLFYFLSTPSIYIRDDLLSSLEFNFGALKNFSKELKVGFLANREYFFNDKQIDKIETFLTYNITKDVALNIGYQAKKMEDKKSYTPTLSLFYYF